MSQTSVQIERAERRSQAIRPGTLNYPMGQETLSIPCTLGNLDFYNRLVAGGGGFQGFQHVFIKILRKDIPAAALAPNASFQRGQNVTLVNNDPDSPGFNEEWELVIAENNSVQPTVILLNLERVVA